MSSNFRSSLQKVKRTPWINTCEFESTGEALLYALELQHNNNAENDENHEERLMQLRHAIHRVAIWRSKSLQGRLPHAIETTATLAELILRDSSYNTSSQTGNASIPVSTMELRLSYSSAIIRGINSLADSADRNIVNNSNSSNSNSTSVANLCDLLNIPRWLVDVRHDASHSCLPSLNTLRMASNTLLAYIGNCYWGFINSRRMEITKQAWDLLTSYTNTLSGYDNNNDESEKAKKQRINITNTKLNEIMKDYVRNIPLDVGVNVLLDYFVRGHHSILEGENSDIDTIPDAPIMAGLFRCNKVEFSQTGTDHSPIQQKYLVLFRIVQNAWSGFVSTLFVELVHTTLNIELESKDTITVATETDSESSWHTLSCLFSWVKYILSRDFHHNLTLSQSMKNKPEEQPYEGKKSEKDIDEFDQSLYLPYHKLQSLYCIPFNSLCDLCIRAMKDSCGSSSSEDEKESSEISNAFFTKKLIQFLESILIDHSGNDNSQNFRVEDYGLPSSFYPTSAKRKRELKLKEAESEFNSMLEEDENTSGHKSDSTDCSSNSMSYQNEFSDDEQSKSSSSSNDIVDTKVISTKKDHSENKISLEDMEAFLDSSSSSSSEDTCSIPNAKRSKTSEECSQPTSTKRESVVSENDKNVSVWAQCTHWESCSIGVLPSDPMIS